MKRLASWLRRIANRIDPQPQIIGAIDRGDADFFPVGKPDWYWKWLDPDGCGDPIAGTFTFTTGPNAGRTIPLSDRR